MYVICLRLSPSIKILLYKRSFFFPEFQKAEKGEIGLKKYTCGSQHKLLYIFQNVSFVFNENHSTENYLIILFGLFIRDKKVGQN